MITMTTEKLYGDVLSLLSLIREDKEKLTEILTFLEDQQLTQYNNRPDTNISDEYSNTILQITESLENGFICFLNPITLEIEQVPQSMYFESQDIVEQNEDKLDEFGLNYVQWDDYIRFEPLGPNEIFIIMENYVTYVGKGDIVSKLEDALDDEFPVESFEKAVANSNLQEDWQVYKRKAMISYVSGRLLNELRMR